MSKVSTKFYSGRLRLGGSVLHEVPITGVPAAEVIMLQYLHGADAVVDLREAKKSEIVTVPETVLEELGVGEDHGWTNRVTREYLRDKFSSLMDEYDKVARVFGPAMNPVPEKLDVELVQPKQPSSDQLIQEAIAKREAELRAKVEEEIRAEMAAKEREAELPKPPAEVTARASEAARKAEALKALA